VFQLVALFAVLGPARVGGLKLSEQAAVHRLCGALLRGGLRNLRLKLAQLVAALL